MFDVLLGNSLAGKNGMGSQTRHSIRPHDVRISELKCTAIITPSHGGLVPLQSPKAERP